MQAIETKPQELQIPHHCCECGKELARGSIQMCAVLSIQRANILCTQRIAWCEGCWGEMPFPNTEPLSWDGYDGPCCE